MLAACNSKKDDSTPSNSSTASVSARMIHPVMPKADVKPVHYTFKAQDGGTFTYESGSSLYFPANSLVDKNGELVTGEVSVSYREFHDVASVYTSGIPMRYDSAGTNYFFETAGMCEVLAFKGNHPVFVNPDNKPVVHMASKQTDQDFNLYYLDTLSATWQPKGRPEAEDAEELAASEPKVSIEMPKPELAVQTKIPVAPVKPAPPTGKRPVIEVKILPGALSELSAYNNLMFEVHEDEKNWDPSASKQQWYHMEAKPGPRHGTYYVVFTGASGQKSFLTRPVLEGKDLDDALKIFEKKDAEYKDLLIKRKQEEEEQERILAEERRLWEEENAAWLKRVQAEREAWERKAGVMNAGAEVVRTFELEGFGIWNCDRPISEPEVQLTPLFTDNNGNKIEVVSPIVLIEGVNGIYRTFNQYIRVDTERKCMIWGIYDGRLAYFTYDDFANSGITKSTKNYTFKMRVSPKEIESSKDIWDVIGVPG